MKVAEIAIRLKAPRSSVYENRHSLTKAGYLAEQAGTGCVFLGPTFMYFGESHQRHNDILKNREKDDSETIPVNGRDGPIVLARGKHYVVAIMETGNRHFHISCNIGEKLPLPWTASGRLLAMHLSRDELSRLVGPDDLALPDGRVLRLEDFAEEVDSARKQGYWIMDGILDGFTHCFAAPVINLHRECVATTCIIAPKQDTNSRILELTTATVAAAAELSQAIGG